MSMRLSSSTEMKVKLQKIIDALYEVNDDNALYLDTEAGEIVLVYDGGVYGGGDGVEDMTPDEIDDSERFIFLPSSFDLNNWQIMQNFIWSLDDARLQDRLNGAIHRSGAFRNFRNVVDEKGLTNEWYKFRDASYRDIATEWCKENAIEWVE